MTSDKPHRYALHQLSEEDRRLWTTVARSITPLRRRPPLHDGADAAEPGRAANPDPGTALKPAKTHPVAGQAKPGKPVPPPPERPRAPALPAAPALAPLGRRERQRLVRGGTAIDARIDLHGLTQSEAHAALAGFLRRAQRDDARFVLVITGKGGRFGDSSERGVLRRQVPHWLRLPEFRTYVVGFEDAHTAHGGEGALYVRIRRVRADPGGHV